jgi:ferredoxin hydrogenase large subunit
MISFETPLKKLKHEVLKNVVLLAKDNNLTKEELMNIQYKVIPGDKPQYRCCVFKERAIVYERTKLAAGYLSDGNGINKQLKDIKDDEQIIYVISSACDRCPINKYSVTEACRGCIAHECMESCPSGAITKINGRAFINQEICKECGMCKKVCPYNAISEVMRPCKKSCPTGALHVDEEDRQAAVDKNKCINCGACMAGCPFGAISDKSYIVPVVNALMEGKDVYAVAAPSIAGQFGPKVSVGQIKDAFLKTGFKDMVEAACGADAVAVHEAEELKERLKRGDKFMTSSCCPGFVSYVEMNFPELKGMISETVSPMIATARLIKKNHPDSMVIFVGPCTAKKSEIKKPNLAKAVDYVLTFEEISALFDAFEIDFQNCNDLPVSDATLSARGFAQSGGLSNAIALAAKEIGVDLKPVKINGQSELKKTLLLAKVGRLDGNFIEGMMCEGGCLDGPAVLWSSRKTAAPFKAFSQKSEGKSPFDNKMLEKFRDVNLSRSSDS